MPGLGNFIGEFLALLGAFRVSIPVTVIAALGLILAPVYALQVIQKVFHGPPGSTVPGGDFGLREMLLMLAMMTASVGIGVYPQPLLDISATALQGLSARQLERGGPP
jgi:NADH-quinone oxidoreductase subunit M